MLLVRGSVGEVGKLLRTQGLDVVSLLRPAADELAQANLVLLSGKQAARSLSLMSPGERWGLTPREEEVALLLAQGWSQGAVAARLGISITTVREHMRRSLEKTGTRNAAGLSWALIRGEPPEPEPGRAERKPGWMGK